METKDLIAEMHRHGESMGRHISSLLQMKPFRRFRIHVTGKWEHEITDPSTVEVRPGVAELKSPAGRTILALEHVGCITILPPVDEPILVKPAVETAK